MMKDEKHKNLSVNQKLVDETCDFLKISGWSFGWCLVMENEDEFWQVDAHRGDIHLVARDKILGLALSKLKTSILGMN
ncbi:MAG TPA: hypothetical protein PKH33_17755 [bacterium]|nr:hypothetical protein [bacterium]